MNFPCVRFWTLKFVFKTNPIWKTLPSVVCGWSEAILPPTDFLRLHTPGWIAKWLWIQSLYCKRGRENTGVSLYRKTDSTVDALIQTVNVDSHTHAHTHTPHSSSQGHVSPVEKKKKEKHKSKTEKQTHKIFGFFSTALSFTRCIPSFRVVKWKWLQH